MTNMARSTGLRLTRPFYSPAEVADLAGVHPSTILNYIRDEKLYAVRLSERTYRIPARAVLGLLAPDQLRPTRAVDLPETRADEWLEELRAEHRGRRRSA
jgi:excisionase family DNA binding protein